MFIKIKLFMQKIFLLVGIQKAESFCITRDNIGPVSTSFLRQKLIDASLSEGFDLVKTDIEGFTLANRSVGKTLLLGPIRIEVFFENKENLLYIHVLYQASILLSAIAKTFLYLVIGAPIFIVYMYLHEYINYSEINFAISWPYLMLIWAICLPLTLLLIWILMKWVNLFFGFTKNRFYKALKNFDPKILQKF